MFLEFHSIKLVFTVGVYYKLIYFGFASAGMNTEKFEYLWDGEDWDLLNRVLSMQLETERIEHPGLYHHFYSKQKNGHESSKAF